MSLLFVLAAHIPDAHNCHLLRLTIESIGGHHRDQPMLVVDNASPDEATVPSVLSVLTEPLRSLIAMRRQPTSHGVRAPRRSFEAER